jgi:hypothetical protein
MSRGSVTGACCRHSSTDDGDVDPVGAAIEVRLGQVIRVVLGTQYIA